ncbi:MAG: glycosyltransferase [Candidatus Saccharimonadales bacterium]
MNIAHLLPTSAIFPLKKHNGRYEWALRLARIQAAAGHTVTIYAGVGSIDDSSVVWKSLTATTEDKRTNNIALMTSAFENHAHDVYHSHFDYLHYLVADLTDKPVIVTQHWFPFQAIADVVPLNTKKNVITVPVTNMMKAEDERLGIPTTDRIYHGIDLSLFTPTTDHTNRLLFVGRIHPSKGISQAIRYAKETNTPLDIIGKINKKEEAYWQTLAGDVDGEHIRYLGSQPQSVVADAFAHAKAFIFPSQVEEAFGQVTIEAQAAGTPVIISNVGPSNELVIDGKTGFVCETDEDYVKAIENIGSIDRTTCHTHAEQFDLTKMVAAYDALYISATQQR